METLKYKIITNKKQYKHYCDALYALLSSNNKARTIHDEIKLLTLLIEKWDNEHNSFSDLDPIQLLKALMKENDLKPGDIMEIIGVTKGMVSQILNYHKGLSKHNIQMLAAHFKVAQEAFNRKYELKTRAQEVATMKATKTKNDRISALDLGTFSVSKRVLTTARSLQTGKTIKIVTHKAKRSKTSKILSGKVK